MPVMSVEEAVADILASDDAPIAVFEAPLWIEELAKRGYRIVKMSEVKRKPFIIGDES